MWSCRHYYITAIIIIIHIIKTSRSAKFSSVIARKNDSFSKWLTREEEEDEEEERSETETDAAAGGVKEGGRGRPLRRRRCRCWRSRPRIETSAVRVLSCALLIYFPSREVPSIFNQPPPHSPPNSSLSQSSLLLRRTVRATNQSASYYFAAESWKSLVTGGYFEHDYFITWDYRDNSWTLGINASENVIHSDAAAAAVAGNADLVTLSQRLLSTVWSVG